ncbi:MAG: N-acetylmuramoyl-L-alanine amidase family protein [Shimia sp.]
MIRFMVIVALCLTGMGAWGEPAAFARVDPARVSLEQSRREVHLELGLTAPVPFRIYALDEPRRIVVEMAEVAWDGLDTAPLAGRRVSGVDVGELAPGWSGLVMSLKQPFVIESAQMRTGAGEAALDVVLRRASPEVFAARAGAPESRIAVDAPDPAALDPGPTVVVIDPGHGGRDPGAVVEGVEEAALMLRTARELQEALRRVGGYEVHLTRDADIYLGLAPRAALARRLEADIFISLHADTVAVGTAEGATVHVLTPEATESASVLLTERLDRDHILAGVDLTGHDDQVAKVLLDVARQETTPRSTALAAALVAGLDQAGARLNTRPRRVGDFAVLRSADVPSVLVEVGFLSSKRDRIDLQSPEKRGRIVAGLAQGISNWVAADRARAQLIRR